MTNNNKKRQCWLWRSLIQVKSEYNLRLEMASYLKSRRECKDFSLWFQLAVVRWYRLRKHLFSTFVITLAYLIERNIRFIYFKFFGLAISGYVSLQKETFVCEIH